jgi:hypothetical protein
MHRDRERQRDILVGFFMINGKARKDLILTTLRRTVESEGTKHTAVVVVITTASNTPIYHILCETLLGSCRKIHQLLLPTQRSTKPREST